jgi:hypothetical protein
MQRFVKNPSYNFFLEIENLNPDTPNLSQKSRKREIKCVRPIGA